MEKVLAYDRSIVAQETGYWCGPAATQVVLNGRGIRRTEADLARRMGTDTDGTDHIGLPAKGARRRDPRGAVDDGADARIRPLRHRRINCGRIWCAALMPVRRGDEHCRAAVELPARGRAVDAEPRLPGRHRLSLRRAHGVRHRPGRTTPRMVGRLRIPAVRQLGLLRADRVVVSAEGLCSRIPARSRTGPDSCCSCSAGGGSVGSAPRFESIQLLGQSHQPRTRPPINFLIHTEEGNASALDLARYCNNTRNQVSYHHTLRDGKLVQLVPLERAAWSVLDANAYTINLCFAGSRAGWTRAQWVQRREDIRIAAYVAVRDCRRFGIPATVITPPYRRGSGILRSRLRHPLPGHRHPPRRRQPVPLGRIRRRRRRLRRATGHRQLSTPKPRAKAWIGKRLTDGETALRGAGVKIGAFAEFEHAHIYWKLGASTAIAIPHADPALPGSGLFETWATDYRFELGPLRLPRPAHSVVTNGAVQTFEHGVLFRKTGSPRGWAVWGRIYQAYASLGSEQAPRLAGRA